VSRNRGPRRKREIIIPATALWSFKNSFTRAPCRANAPTRRLTRPSLQHNSDHPTVQPIDRSATAPTTLICLDNPEPPDRAGANPDGLIAACNARVDRDQAVTGKPRTRPPCHRAGVALMVTAVVFDTILTYIGWIFDSSAACKICRFVDLQFSWANCRAYMLRVSRVHLFKGTKRQAFSHSCSPRP